MIINYLIFIAIFLSQVSTQNNGSCDQNSKIVQYSSTICQIFYEQCSSSGKLQIESCVGYRCKFQLGGKCYYYSYQVYDTRKCLSSCCGYYLSPIQTYTSAQISQCLEINSYINDSFSDRPQPNKLAIILGSILGVIFFIIVITCICCRNRIRACCDSDHLNSNARDTKIYKGENYQPQTNNIKFILQSSEHSFNYDRESQCTICLAGDNQIETKCGHWFHLKCLILWLEKSYKCPNCVSQELNPIKFYCRKCQKPFVQLKLSRKNDFHSLKKLIPKQCKTCNELIQPM